MKLIIFDLDQTLVDSIKFHDAATVTIFRQFFNIEAHLTEVDLAGKSLKENFLELARLKDIPEGAIQPKLPELLYAYDSAFKEGLPADVTGFVLPGVEALLLELLKTPHLLMLYTGDSPAVTQALLRATKLNIYFRYSFYGTEVVRRSDMVRQAITTAGQITGKIFRDKDIIIIGDSIRDIKCGKEFNALIIAVATGFHSIRELRAMNPDYLVPDLKDTDYILKAIGNNRC